MKRKLIFASHNKNKTKEIRAMLPEGYALADLEDMHWCEEIIESGSTLEENARIKCKTIYQEFGGACFAEDTGLEVYSLGMAPGVHSARYAGPQRNDEENVRKLLASLAASSDRKARFRTVICYMENGLEYFFEGIAEGQIALEREGTQGFGYDPVFIPNGFSQTFAMMDARLKNEISHRRRAMDAFLRFLQTRH